MSKPMSQEEALEALCVACTTLVMNGKLVHGSREAQALHDAAEVLGAFKPKRIGD
jgi:hypothetical protein